MSTQTRLWESYNQAGSDAYEQGNYAEAEKQFLAALQEAENFGPEGPRPGDPRQTVRTG